MKMKKFVEAHDKKIQSMNEWIEKKQNFVQDRIVAVLAKQDNALLAEVTEINSLTVFINSIQLARTEDYTTVDMIDDGIVIVETDKGEFLLRFQSSGSYVSGKYDGSKGYTYTSEEYTFLNDDMRKQLVESAADKTEEIFIDSFVKINP